MSSWVVTTDGLGHLLGLRSLEDMIFLLSFSHLHEFSSILFPLQIIEIRFFFATYLTASLCEENARPIKQPGFILVVSFGTSLTSYFSMHRCISRLLLIPTCVPCYLFRLPSHASNGDVPHCYHIHSISSSASILSYIDHSPSLVLSCSLHHT